MGGPVGTPLIGTRPQPPVSSMHACQLPRKASVLMSLCARVAFLCRLSLRSPGGQAEASGRGCAAGVARGGAAAARAAAPHGLGDVVDVLRLDDGVQVVLQDAREVVLQLAATEVREDLLPVRRVLRPGAHMVLSLRRDASVTRCRNSAPGSPARPVQRSAVKRDAQLSLKRSYFTMAAARALGDLRPVRRAPRPSTDARLGCHTGRPEPASLPAPGRPHQPRPWSGTRKQCCTNTRGLWHKQQPSCTINQRRRPGAASARVTSASGVARLPRWRTSKRPRLGFSLPASTLSAVDLPMPAPAAAPPL